MFLHHEHEHDLDVDVDYNNVDMDVNIDVDGMDKDLFKRQTLDVGYQITPILGYPISE
jgi:hypothetical protein